MRRVLAWVGAVALAATAGTAGAEAIGFVAVAQGDVQIQQGGAWQAASTDSDVAIGDTIRTGSGASAKIVLVDDTLLRIDEETELRIETWHVGDAATKELSVLRQTRGRLRTTVGDAFGGTTRLEVHIPTAAIGIKGTDFEVVNAGLWEACLLSGGIEVRNRFGSASPPPGQCVYAYADQAPGGLHPNPRQPLVVSESAGGETSPGLAADFGERIEIQVGSEPPTGPGNPPTNQPGAPYRGTVGRDEEDELQIFKAPEITPINQD